ncbi:MAG: VRR-NUC domain-containing protein [Spirochaetaceae bacterium]|nr:VRR-NUC domain-containing protein [Spirochaetaceae bacterium]
MKKYSAPEKSVKNECLEYLKLMNIFCWNNPSGAMRTADNRFMSFGLKGSADIIGLLPTGRFIAVECKSDKGKLSEAQQAFLDKVKSMGGLAVVAKSYKDIEAVLLEEKYI